MKNDESVSWERYVETTNELFHLRALNAELLAALKEMVEWWGAMHEHLCPGDDTCFCKHAAFNRRIGSAIAKAEVRE